MHEYEIQRYRSAELIRRGAEGGSAVEYRLLAAVARLGEDYLIEACAPR